MDQGNNAIIFHELQITFLKLCVLTLIAFTVLLITVVLTVVLVVTHKTFINAQAIPTVESGSRAK